MSLLTPVRNIGFMAFDWNDAETRTWSYGVFHESTNEFGESMQDSTALAFTSRTTWSPWHEDRPDGPHLLHWGASYSYRRLNPQLRGFDQTPEVVLKSGFDGTPNFVDTGLIALDDGHVAGVEAARVWGSFSMQGEYLFWAGRQPTSGHVFFHGGYLEAQYWLTGESRDYNRRLGIHGAARPHCNFFCRQTDNGICSGSGAWEAAVRVSYLDVNSGAIQGGDLTNVTLGLNWNYALRSRILFNYVHAFLDRGNLHSNADILALRFQFTF